MEADKPAPGKHGFLVFAEKRGAELVWNGESKEVIGVALRFQVIEHVNEPGAGQGRPLRLSLIDSDSRGSTVLAATIEQVSWRLSVAFMREDQYWDMTRSVNPP